MSFCPTDCANDTLVANVNAGCNPTWRALGIDRIGFFNCGIDLPSPLTCNGLQALVDADTLAFSQQLRNVTVNDPTFEDITIADCMPVVRRVTERIITFEDIIDVTKVVASPASTTPYFDLDFWADKVSFSATLRYLFVMCDGSIQIAKDSTGNYAQASLDVFRSFERQGTGRGAFTLEIKKGQLSFNVDPIALRKPELDANDEVFLVTDCEGLIP